MRIKDRLIYRARQEFAPRFLNGRGDCPVKWGFIGAGYMANVFGAAIAAEGDQVAAVTSISEQSRKRFARKFRGCKYYKSVDELLGDTGTDLDVIYIATPLDSHFDLIKRCLLGGFNVLCEKPVCRTESSYEELRVIANAKKVILMEAMWMKCLPTFDYARKWIAKGLLGDIELLDVSLTKFIPESKRLTNLPSDSGAPYSGVLYDFGIYTLAFLVEFLVPGKYKVTKVNNVIDGETDLAWELAIKSSQCSANVFISALKLGKNTARIVGTKGQIVWDAPFNRTGRVTLIDAEGFTIEEMSFSYKYLGFEYQVRDVKAALRIGADESKLAASGPTKILASLADFLRRSDKDQKHILSLTDDSLVVSVHE